jgi:hypothetical protein
MQSLPVLFDPALLAFIPIADPEEFVARVTFLVRWARIIGTTNANVQIAPDVREFLIRNGFFPAHSSVEKALDSLNLRYRYAPQDIIGSINSIFSRASTEFYCCVKDEFHSDFTSLWHEYADLNSQTQRTVMLARIEQLLHGTPQKLALATLIMGRTAAFSAKVEMIDPDGLSGLASAELPKTLAGDLTLASDFEGVLDLVSAQELWTGAINNSDIKLAIQIRCRERLKSLNTYTSMKDLPEFYVGSDFYGSLVRNQSNGTGRFASLTLEGCSSALLQMPNFDWKAFNRSNRKVDNAAPLRAHLSEGNMAMRLMAWRRSDAQTGTCLELSNVGPKWEEEISYTDPTKAV